MLTRMWLFAGKEWTEKIKCGKRKHLKFYFCGNLSERSNFLCEQF